MSEDRFQLLRALEAILFAAAEPLSVPVLAARLPDGADIPGLLQELQGLYANRGVNLVERDGNWAFRTATDLAAYFQIAKEQVKKLTRAAVETLAIVAYHQPVTRAEIEEIRGVALSRGTLDSLLEAGWIKPKGRRETPGNPVEWATTQIFLDHFGLESLAALPGIEELRAAGLLEKQPSLTTLGIQALRPSDDGAGPDDDAADTEELDEDALVAALETADESVEDDASGEAADQDAEPMQTA